MNPYGPTGDLFRTQADQGANNFTDPMNMAHLYPGWGFNPNYNTPYHDAPYRPPYRGPNPYASYERPGFFGSLNQTFSPFYQNPYWGNPVDRQINASHAMGHRPMDGAMNFMQNYGVPIAGAIASNYLLQGYGKKLGQRFGEGLASRIGSGALTSTIARGAFGMIGSMALPLVATGAVFAAGDVVANHYIRNRQNADMVSDNFSGSTFDGNYGNVVSGRGFSHRQAFDIGAQINRQGIQDKTFSANQYSGIAGMGMRAGLFDDVGAGDISKRVSSIASQIKMIVAISKDPNIQTAIEELGKLRLGGASISGGVNSAAMGAYGSISMAASAAGASVQRVMNTVGTQGQYMYQMNGITPYLGQVAAANAFSGFAAAQRAGLLSTAQFARMGGLEGATQSALAGGLAASQTPYNRIVLANQYLGGVNASGVVNNVTAFGQMAARDPLKAAGGMALYGNQMISQQMAKEGNTSAEDQAIDILKTMGVKRGANGYSPEHIAMVLQNVMGMTPDQVQAYASMRASQTNKSLLGKSLKAFRASQEELTRAAIDQNMTGNGIMDRIGRVYVDTKKGISGAMNEYIAEPIGGVASDLADAGMKMMDWVGFSGSIKDEYFGASVDMNKVRKAGGGSDTNKILERLNRVAKGKGSGSEIAQRLLQSGFEGPEAKKLFAEFLKSQGGSFRKYYDSLDSSSALFDETSKLAKGSILRETVDVQDKYVKDVVGTTAGSTLDGLRMIGQATEIFGSDSRLGTDLEDILKDAKYAELSGSMKGLTTEKKIERIKELTLKGAESGLLEISRIAQDRNLSVEKVMANPRMLTRDPEVLGKLREAISKGDKATVGTIIQQELAKSNGGKLRGMGLSLNSRASREELANTIKASLTKADSSGTAVKASGTEVDWSTFVTASNTIDKGASLFWQTVVKFDATVNKMSIPGLGSSSTNPI